MEYYATIKRGEVPTRATMWMNLENNMVSERSQSQQAAYCVIPFI